MTLRDAVEGKEYVIRQIVTDDEELDAIVQGVIDEGGTTQDLALTMLYAYEAYITEEA